MTVPVKTTQEVSDNIIAGLESELSQTIPLLPRAFSRVLAKVLAAVFVLLYKYGGFIFLQMFVQHATMRETTIRGRIVRPLVELGRLYGVGDPVAAVQAEHTITVTVLTQGGTLPAGTLLVREETDVLYQTTAPTPLNAATVTPTVRANVTGAGTIGNLTNGDKLEFVDPLGEVVTAAVVASQVVAGVEGETVEAYRKRILDRVQSPPKGGALANYREWAKTVPGIIGVYPYGGAFPGEVDVYVEATTASSNDPDGIPTEAQLYAVSAAIQGEENGLATRRPVGAAMNVLPIRRWGFNVTIGGFWSPDVAAVADIQQAISDGLDEFLRSHSPYIPGLATLPTRSDVFAGQVAGLAHELAQAQGASIKTVGVLQAGETVPEGEEPPASWELGRGGKAKLVAVVFSEG